MISHGGNAEAVLSAEVAVAGTVDVAQGGADSVHAHEPAALGFNPAETLDDFAENGFQGGGPRGHEVDAAIREHADGEGPAVGPPQGGAASRRFDPFGLRDHRGGGGRCGEWRR